MKKYKECKKCKWIVAEKDFPRRERFHGWGFYIERANICKECAEEVQDNAIFTYKDGK